MATGCHGGGTDGSARGCARSHRARRSKDACSLRLPAWPPSLACGIFMDVVDVGVVRAVDVLHHGSRLRYIGGVVVDHGRTGLRGRGALAVTPGPFGIAPVHIPGFPAPGRMPVHGLGQHDSGTEAQQAGHHGHAGHGSRRRHLHIAVAAIYGQRLTVDLSRVVLGNVDRIHLGRADFNELLRWLYDRVGQRCDYGSRRIGHGGWRGGQVDLELTGGLERAGLVGPVAHDLYGVHHIRGSVVIGLAQRRGPGQIGGHLFQHIGKLGQRFDGRVPVLGVDGIAQRRPLQAGVLPQPGFGGADLVWIGGTGQDLGHQLVRVQRNRRHHPVERVCIGWHIGCGLRLGGIGRGGWCQGWRCAVRLDRRILVVAGTQRHGSGQGNHARVPVAREHVWLQFRLLGPGPGEMRHLTLLAPRRADHGALADAVLTPVLSRC